MSPGGLVPAHRRNPYRPLLFANWRSFIFPKARGSPVSYIHAAPLLLGPLPPSPLFLILSSSQRSPFISLSLSSSLCTSVFNNLPRLVLQRESLFDIDHIRSFVRLQLRFRDFSSVFFARTNIYSKCSLQHSPSQPSRVSHPVCSFRVARCCFGTDEDFDSPAGRHEDDCRHRRRQQQPDLLAREHPCCRG